MSFKSLSVATVVLLASLSITKAQVFTTGVLALDGSTVENASPVLYAYNLGDDLTDTTLNGVTFVGFDNQTQTTPNFSISNSGGFDGTNNKAGDPSDPLVPGDTLYNLQSRGAYNNLTLSLNNLTPGVEYAAQLEIGEQPGDNRSQSYTDGAVTSDTVFAHSGPQFITDTFTATGTTETLQGNVGGGNGAQLTGFVVEIVPEPSTWAMMILGLAGMAFFVSRRSFVRS
jgi:hypothetical protein